MNFEFELDQVVSPTHILMMLVLLLLLLPLVEAAMSPGITINERIDHNEYKQQKLRQHPPIISRNNNNGNGDDDDDINKIMLTG